MTFARDARDGRPREPLGGAWPKLEVVIAEARPGEVGIDHAGVVTIDDGAIDRRPHPRLPPHWKDGWPARVEVRARGFLPVETDWIELPMRADDAPRTIELPSAPAVEGSVVDERGAPLAGVEVELVRPIDSEKNVGVGLRFGVPYRDDHELHVRATTDAAGGFALPYTEDASFLLRARALGRAPVATAPFGLRRDAPPPPRVLVMTVPDGGIEGTVRGFDGDPTLGAVVVCCRADGFAQSVLADTEGRYRLALPPGRYRVNRGELSETGWTAISRGPLGLPLWTGPGDAPAVEPAQFAVEVRAGEFTPWDLDARRPRGAAAIVRVDAEDEDPACYPVSLSRFLDDLSVELAWPRREEFEVVLESPALFPELPPGRYELTVGGESRGEVDLPAGEGTELAVALHPTTVAGRLLDEHGAGVAAKIEIQPPTPMSEREIRVVTFSSRSDDDGRFEFEVLRPGWYRVRASVDRGGEQVLVYDDLLSVPRTRRFEPVLRLLWSE
ncbi:MAG: carboxypeptidase-like regulatory domain-containing protein [Planctomycetota bacterium JB042]